MDIVESYQYKSDTKYSSWFPWLICFVSSLFFFYEFIQGNMFASIADNIMQDFDIKADKMTYLSSIYYLSNVVFLFVAGITLDRFSAKNTIIIAMVMCVISTFILANSHSFSLALGCRFVTGIGSAFCFLGPIRITSRWFPPKKMAMVTGIIVTIAMTGGMLAQYPLTKLVLHIGWRNSLTAIAWLGVMILVVMLWILKDTPNTSKPKNPPKINILLIMKTVYLNLQTIRAALYGSLMNMAIAVFGAVMGCLYLMQRLNISKEDASIVNTMLFLGTILGGPFMGWVSDRLGLRIAPMKFGAIASLLTIVCILYGDVSYHTMAFLFFILGFFTSSQVISYALVAESSSSAITASAVSIVSILTQSGYIIYQNLFSMLLIGHGGMKLINNIPTYSLADYQYAAKILPVGLVLAAISLFGLKETYCHRTQG
ncbi:MAG: MFS transporter [Legionellaceae bacterium]|nr:MFS transporter [Legionellaceae bacterium]